MIAEKEMDPKEFFIRVIDTEKLAKALGTSKVYSPAELAAELDVSIPTLYNWKKTLIDGKPLLEDPVKVGLYSFWTQEQLNRLRLNLHERDRTR